MALDYLTYRDIERGYQPSWYEMAQLDHEAQVRLFNWCSCEDSEEKPYTDCP